MTRRRRRSETCRRTTRCYAYRTGGCSWWDLSLSHIGFCFPSLLWLADLHSAQGPTFVCRCAGRG
eukprot:317375-Chlamydomonas_euryale.AAC.1